MEQRGERQCQRCYFYQTGHVRSERMDLFLFYDNWYVPTDKTTQMAVFLTGDVMQAGLLF